MILDSIKPTTLTIVQTGGKKSSSGNSRRAVGGEREKAPTETFLWVQMTTTLGFIQSTENLCPAPYKNNDPNININAPVW